MPIIEPDPLAGEKIAFQAGKQHGEASNPAARLAKLNPQGGGPLTDEIVAMRLLQIVGDHLNGIGPQETEAVAKGLLMVNGNHAARQLGKMLTAIFELGREWEQTENDPESPGLWLN